jgi:hypothetical protein
MPNLVTSRRRGLWLIVVVGAVLVGGSVIGVGVLRLAQYRHAIRAVRAEGAELTFTAERVSVWFEWSSTTLWGSVPEEFQSVERLALPRRSREPRRVRHFLARSDLSLIRLLSIPNSDADDASVGRLHTSRRLESLDLSNTLVSDRGVRSLSGLPSLRHLSLEGTNISGRSLEALHGCGWLETLNLSRTACGDADVRSLSGLELRNLRLRSTKVTDQGLEALAGIRSLNSVDVDESAVTDTGFARFRKLRTDVDVYYRGVLHHRADAADFTELLELFNQESVYTDSKHGRSGP